MAIHRSGHRVRVARLVDHPVSAQTDRDGVVMCEVTTVRDGQRVTWRSDVSAWMWERAREWQVFSLSTVAAQNAAIPPIPLDAP